MDKSAKEIEANGGHFEMKISEICSKSAIRETFWPIAVIAKCFGLFPSYNMTFTENITERRIKWIQLVGYLYTLTIFALLTGGGILCWVNQPKNIEAMMSKEDDIIDKVVILTVFYLLLVMGSMSLFVFPRQSRRVLRYIDHFAHIDKILCFSGKNQENERKFARGIILHLAMSFVTSAIVFSGIFTWTKPDIKRGLTDYLMIPLAILATMVHVIPTAVFVFFVNGIRERLALFNEKMQNLILPITPSCSSCESYLDFGDELNQVCPRLSSTLTEDLDKMRVLHEEISSLTDETCTIFGSHIMREFLYNIIAVISYTYFTIFMLTKDPIYMSIFGSLDLFILLKMYHISTYGHLITVESASSLNLLNKACFLQLSPECTIQVEAFIKKLEKPNVITAAGYFVVNRAIISVIFGAMTTYLIILIQFKVSIHTTEFNNMGNCTECFAPTFWATISV